MGDALDSSSSEDFPPANGEASCDGKLRIRLKDGWPNYFLRHNRTACDLFVCTLDHETIIIFERRDFIRLRADLMCSNDPDNLLPRYAEWGGEAQLDHHGRFVLPARVRKFLKYDPAGRDFTIRSELPVTLFTQEQHAEEVASLSYGPDVRLLGKAAFARTLAKGESR
jgi:hypothetical protein